MAKTTPKPRRLYIFKDDELYMICLIGWQNCKRNISDFTSFKGYYTLSFIDDMIDMVVEADKIPDEQERVNVAERFRIDLKNKANECCAKWQVLKNYVVYTFSSSSLKTRIEDAGYKNYRKSSTYNWEILIQLMLQGSKFIADNLTELQANDNMPAVFQAEFNQLKDEFNTLYMQFQQATVNAKEETTKKVNANNQIYKQLVIMFKDGYQIYRHDAARRKEFTLRRVVKRVRGTMTAYHNFEVKAKDSVVIKDVVANSPFVNIGNTELVVCNGDIKCSPDKGTTVNPNKTIIIEPDIKVITVLNTDIRLNGKCKVRVIKH